MKKATCAELGGVCDVEITGETAEQMGDNSKHHVMEMVFAGDKPHSQAVDQMMKLSQEDQQKWYEDFKNNFDSLPDA